MLVLVVPVFDESNDVLQHLYQPLHQAMMQGIQKRLKEGTLTLEQANALITPVYLRSREEFEAPFKAKNDDDGESFEGLVLESFTTRVLDNPYWHDDVNTYAHRYCQSVMAWTYNAWFGNLAKVCTDPALVIEEICKSIRDAARTHPQRFRTDYVEAYLTIRKQQRPQQ